MLYNRIKIRGKGGETMKVNKYQADYWKRIYLIQDYIEANPTDIFTSEQLAKISGLSKYHLHRIFSALTNESIFQYATRVKMEWALGMVTERKNLSITEIAYELGFSDSAVFSRSFKKYFDMSPKEARSENSNNCKDTDLNSPYNRFIDEKKSPVQGEIRVASIQSMKVIYKRILGSYGDLDSNNSSLGELYQFGIAKDLLDSKTALPLTIYHSHPDLTSPRNQRTSNCIIIKEGIDHVDSDKIGVMEIPVGLYGIIHFELSLNDYPLAWEFAYSEWLLSSGYFPRNSFPFEVYLNNPLEEPARKHIVEIYIPIEPIRE